MTKFKALLSRFIEIVKLFGKTFVKLFFDPVRSFFTVFAIRNKLREERLQRNLTDNAIWGAGLRRFEKDVELEEVKFAFEQAEKLLKDTVEDSQQIVNRINIVITICAGALIFLGGHIGGILANKNFGHLRKVNSVEFIKYHFTLLPACFLAIIFLLILICLVYRLIALDYYSVGSQPNQLFVRQYYMKDNLGIPTLIKMYLGELEDYQDRITENKAKNKTRWTELNLIIRIAAISTLEAGLILIIQFVFLL